MAVRKRTGASLVVRQILIVSYLLGLLWVKRHPSSLIFSAAMPFSLLFVIFVVSGGQNLPQAVAGGLVVAAVGYGLSLGSDLVWYRVDYRLQDFFISSQTSSLTYMLGIAISLLMWGLPSLGILAGMLVYISGSLFSIPYILATVILVWGSMASLSFVISSYMPDGKNIEELTTFLQVVLGVLPPIFYSIEILPLGLQYIAYSLSTTQASLVLQQAAGVATPADWSVVIGLGIMAGHLAVFGFLAKSKAVWREG
jgi:ABC-2 type transport system permease protein